jgi:large repetitive protein
MALRIAALALLVLAFAATKVSGTPAGSDFTISPDPPTEGQATTFTFVPGPGLVGAPTVEWDIVGSDEFEATGTSVTHVYDSDGSRTVRMRVTDDEGADVVTKTFTVSPAPNAAPSVDFSVSANPTHNLPVSFSATGSDPDGDALSYSWTFGDGGTSTAEDPQHTYSSPGTRTVTVTVSDGQGGVDTASKQVTLANRTPSVTFSSQPASPLPGTVVSFSATASDPNGDSLSYSWTFGDGGTSTAGDPEHTYSSPGTRTVTVTVTDAHGATASESKSITVQNRPPSAAFDFSPASPLPGQTVLFSPDVSDPDGDGVTVSWNFGSGSTKTGPNSATYAAPGTRTVTLTATDSRGASTTETRQITVRDPAGPVASFVVSPAVPLVGEPVTFTNTSLAASGLITSAVWDLDDDGEFDDSPASWSFGAPGNHDVWLRVTQTNGNSAVAKQVVRVNAPPSSDFVWSPTDPVTGQAIDFFSVAGDVVGGLASQAWDLDADGQFDDATGAIARWSFGLPGIYEVGLQVTDTDGAVSTVRRAVAVAAAPANATQVRFITPFPVVRLSGRLLPRGARVERLAVRAPRGVLVRVTCKGVRCPVRAMRKRSAGRAVRFKAFERQLRAGTRLEIFVSKRGAIGKYTRFRIRAGLPPARTDRCLFPGTTRPRRCP